MEIKELSPQDKGKRAAGCAAVDDLVRPHMKLGLGTGSTAYWAVKRTAELYREGKLPGLLVVATSFDTEILCQEEGLELRSLTCKSIDSSLDLYLDGADEVTPTLDCIKGGGAAHLQEKIVCDASKRFVIIADESKKKPHLGTGFAIPLEILSMARIGVLKKVEALGGQGSLRYGKGKQGPIVTDNGHIILDVKFPQPIDCKVMERELKLIVGVFEVGLFAGRAEMAYLGKADGSVEILKK